MVDDASAEHAVAATEVAARLGTDPSRGLGRADAATRLRTGGPNAIEQARSRSPVRLLLEQLTDPLVLILLVAAAISGTLLGETVDSAVILAIVALNAALGFFQHNRAERALATLRQLAAPQATVVREGREERIPAADLVLGDVIVLRTGDRVPADARVLEARHLSSGEAILTGEAFPQEKSASPAPREAAVAERTSMVYMGTTVLTGRGRAVVTATGGRTVMGGIAGLLREPARPTRLQRELGRVGRVMGIGALVVVAAVFLLGWLRGYPADSMFLTAVALAVAAVPEGLPAVVTITLAMGVQRLARQRAIVRRLEAVETLGAASVICTDKTGTLTRNRIQVEELASVGLRFRSPLPPGDDRMRRYWEVAALCNDAARGAAGGDPIEVALLRSMEEAGVDAELIRAANPRVDEVAFDSRRKLMSTLHRAPDQTFLLAVKGAPEMVQARSQWVETESGTAPMDAATRTWLAEQAQDMASRGLRTLAVAWRRLRTQPSDVRAAESGLTMIGLIGLSDEVRPEAADSVAMARAAGIRVVMVTGDHARTAAAVMRRLALAEPGQEVMPGERLAQIGAGELTAEVERFAAYARVDPADKVKIVRAWQSRGELVAMTGDGVNDAPALHAADIGVAMGSGTDVSRDASAMVLADDNFATLVSAVREGRAIFDNLRKVVRFLLTTNASEIIVMAVGLLVFGALGQPLLPVQLLWINLVTDGLPVLAVGSDTAAGDLMRRRPRPRLGLLTWSDLTGILWRAAVLAAATIGALLYGQYAAGAPWIEVQTILFTTLVTVQLTYAFVIRAEDRPNPFQGGRRLALALLVSALLQLAVVYLPVGNLLFRTVPLPAVDLFVIVGLNALALAAIVLGSAVRRRLRARG